MVKGLVLEGVFDLSHSTLPLIVFLQSLGFAVPFSLILFNSFCGPFSSMTSSSRVNEYQSVSIGGVISPKGVVSLKVKPNQELESGSFPRLSQNNPSESYSPVRCMSVELGFA